MDVLLSNSDLIKTLKNKTSVGVLCHHASVTDSLVHIVDALLAQRVAISRLFGPEHGIRGCAQDMESVSSQLDPFTGIPTVSLYGSSYESLAPNPATLKNLDCLIVDLQDVGSRYYTFVNTMAMAITACAKANIEVWILDRPNPIGGQTEGNLVTEGYHSFVGYLPIPNRHWMTIGELARYILDRTNIPQKLVKIIDMEGWRRSMWFDETLINWVAPSPNMPTLQTATVYPGMCLLEGTNLSEGRGTTQPFELFGAPYINAPELVACLKEYNLPGVQFRPAQFVPKFQKWVDQTCEGAQLHIINRDIFCPVLTGFTILHGVKKLYPQTFAWREEVYEFVDNTLAIDLLLGEPLLRHVIEDSGPTEEIQKHFIRKAASFKKEIRPYLVYPE